jgi:hypothetical protein
MTGFRLQYLSINSSFLYDIDMEESIMKYVIGVLLTLHTVCFWYFVRCHEFSLLLKYIGMMTSCRI